MWTQSCVIGHFCAHRHGVLAAALQLAAQHILRLPGAAAGHGGCDGVSLPVVAVVCRGGVPQCSATCGVRLRNMPSGEFEHVAHVDPAHHCCISCQDVQPECPLQSFYALERKR